MMSDNEAVYTVWVGGVEVNDYYVTKKQAEALAREFIADGYDDVQIERVYQKDSLHTKAYGV